MGRGRGGEERQGHSSCDLTVDLLSTRSKLSQGE